MSGTSSVMALSGVMPPRVGDAVTSSKWQAYVIQSNQQEEGHPLGFMMVLVYHLIVP